MTVQLRSKKIKKIADESLYFIHPGVILCFNCLKAERWSSGRRRHIGNVVYCKVPRVRIPLSPPFFLQKKWRTKPQGFTSLCRQAQLHSKNKVFSSHLHKIPEALLVKTLHFIPLVKTFASLSCEVFSLLRVRMVLFFILRFA